MNSHEIQQAVLAPITWAETDDPEFPYSAVVNDRRWLLRINDFPDEPLFSLIIDGKHVADFDDWPEHWKR